MDKFVENDGVKIHYDVKGNGKDYLVLVSGFAGDKHMWKYNSPYFEKYFKVIRIDNRGAGLSDKPEYPYTMAMFSNDIKAVLDEINVKKTYILGASMGGLITLQFYRDYPEYVKGLFLSCTIPGIPSRLQSFVRKMIKSKMYNFTSSLVIPRIVSTINTILEKRKPSIGSIAENFELPEVDMRIINILLGQGIKNMTKEELVDLIYSTLVYKVTDEVKEFFEEQMSNPKPANKGSQLEAVLKCSHHDILKDIKVPTLIIHGRNDRLLNIGEPMYMNKNIHDSDLIIYGDAGHFLFLENYNQFNDDIVRYSKLWKQKGKV